MEDKSIYTTDIDTDMINIEETMCLDECDEEIVEEISFLPLDCTEQCYATFDDDEFQRGIDDYSYTCGALTALCNSGLNPSEAIEYIVNRETIKHNLEVTRIGATATVESAKHASIKNELETI